MSAKRTSSEPVIQISILVVLGLLLSSLSIAWDQRPDPFVLSHDKSSAGKVAARPFAPPLPVQRYRQKNYPRPVKPTDGLIFAFCRWLGNDARVCRAAQTPTSPCVIASQALRDFFQTENECARAFVGLWSCDRWYGLDVI